MNKFNWLLALIVLAFFAISCQNDKSPAEACYLQFGLSSNDDVSMFFDNCHKLHGDIRFLYASVYGCSGHLVVFSCNNAIISMKDLTNGMISSMVEGKTVSNFSICSALDSKAMIRENPWILSDNKVQVSCFREFLATSKREDR